MKICTWCGKENDDSTLSCRECGTSEFKSEAPVSNKGAKGSDSPPEIIAIDESKVEFMRSLAAVTPRAWVTPAIVGLNVILFLLVSVDAQTIFSPSIAKLIAWGADFGPLTVTNHQWWRLLSSCFLHIGVVHLACNLYSFASSWKANGKTFRQLVFPADLSGVRFGGQPHLIVV